MTSGQYVRPGTPAFCGPPAFLRSTRRGRRGTEGGKRASLTEVGVARRSPEALVGRRAARGRGLRAAAGAGAGATARAPPPRGPQCQAGGDSGWKLRRALQRGLRRRLRLRHLGPGEQRALGGASQERAGRADLFSQHVPAMADRSRRGVGQGRWRVVGWGGHAGSRSLGRWPTLGRCAGCWGA